MLGDRDFIIFFLLLLGVVLIRFLPVSSAVRLILLGFMVVAQGIFIYHGLTRGRR